MQKAHKLHINAGETPISLLNSITVTRPLSLTNRRPGENLMGNNFVRFSGEAVFQAVAMGWNQNVRHGHLEGSVFL
jgi:hypothetical protein